MDERQRRVDAFNAGAAGDPNEMSYFARQRETARSLHGRKSLDAMFPGQTPTAIVPFPSASQRKGKRLYNQEAVTAELNLPGRTRTVDIDPRILSGSQPGVTRAGVEYYTGGEYERSGRTFAEQHNVGNQFPFVVSKRRPVVHEGGPSHEHVIISGHHRASAALLRGERLRTRWLEEDE